MTYQQQHKPKDAERAYRTARQALQPALKRAPNDPDALQQLSYVESNSGQILMKRGELEAAQSAFSTLLQVARKLVASNPRAVAFAQILIGAHFDLAHLAMRRGKLATAMAQYRAAGAAGASANAQIPNHNQLVDFVVYASGSLGAALPWIGDSEQGVRHLESALEMARKLVKSDPGNAVFQDDLGICAARLARLKRTGGHLQSAARLNAEALQIYASLVKKAPENADSQGHYVQALIEQAAQAREAGDAPGVRTAARHALRILEPALAKQPDSHRGLLPTMTATLLLASVTRDTSAARTLHEQALQTMQAVKARQNDPRLLALRVQALLALKQNADAQPLIKRLWTAGYRDPEFVALLKHQKIAYPANPAFQTKLLAATAKAADHIPAPKASKPVAKQQSN
jgi:tetratricopeptide (TPR) repeat protein